MPGDPVVWLNGEFLPLSSAHISPEDRGFLFADGVYEALRFYPPFGDRPGGCAFVDEHIERLRHSLAGIRLEVDGLEELPEVFEGLLGRNGLLSGDATLYLQITRGAAPRAHTFPEDGVRPTLYATARAFEPPYELWKTGVEAAMIPDERWGRCDLKTIALLPNILARQAAEEKGAFEAVLHRDGVITEGSHTSVLFVREGRIVTHPEGPAILPSVTRAVVLRLCRRLGIEVIEEGLPLADLDRVEEMMLLGTSSEVMPVVKVDGRRIGEGRPGKVTRQLQAAYAELRP